jgi:hypothetical protein
MIGDGGGESSPSEFELFEEEDETLWSTLQVEAIGGKSSNSLSESIVKEGR